MEGVISQLDLHPKELMNKAHPYYQQHIRGKEFNMDGWLNVLIKNPQLLKSPLAVSGKNAIMVNTPTDIYKLTAN